MHKFVKSRDKHVNHSCQLVPVWLVSKIFIKPGAPACGRHAWFLIITFVCECMRVCVCVCVRPRGHKLLVAWFRLQMIGRIIAAAFQFHFMALAIDVIDRRDPSNKIRCQL